MNSRYRKVASLSMLVVAAILWAAINTILKHVGQTNLHPVGVSCLLYVSALSVLVPAHVVLRNRHTGGLKPLLFFRPANLAAGLSKACETLFFVYAVRAISATHATMLTKMSPVWVYLILVIFFRVKLRMVQLLGVACAVAGVAILLGGAGTLRRLGEGTALGAVFAILSGLSFACFSVVLKKAPSFQSSLSARDRLQSTVTFLGSALLFMLPLGIIFLPSRVPRFTDCLWIYIAGSVFTGSAYFLYYTALTQLSSLLAVVMLSLIVVFTMLFEHCFLGIATLTPAFAAGAAAIVLGVLFVLTGDNVKSSKAGI